MLDERDLTPVVFLLGLVISGLGVVVGFLFTKVFPVTSDPAGAGIFVSALSVAACIVVIVTYAVYSYGLTSDREQRRHELELIEVKRLDKSARQTREES